MSVFYFIVWGTKQVKRRLGYVADFCPICREVQPHRIDRIGMAGHVYYIPFGEGQLVGYHGTCCTCHLLTNADPNRHPKLSKTLSSSLEHLVQETFPNLESHYAHRFKIEQDLKHYPQLLPDGLRSVLLEEPFRLVAPMLELRKGLYFDRESTIGALSAVLAVSLMTMLGSAGPYIFLGSLLYMIVELIRSQTKYLHRTIVPLLSQTLCPLHPTVDELRGCLNQLAIAHQSLGRKLKPEVLYLAILQSAQKSPIEATSISNNSFKE